MHLLSQVPRLEAHSMLYPRPLHRTASEPGAGQQTQHSPCCPRSIGCLANHCSETHPSVDTPLPGTPPFSFTSFILFFFLMYSFYLKEVEREIFYGLAQPPSALRTRLGQAEASPALAKWSGHLAVLPSPSTRARSCSGWNWRSMGYQRCTWQHLPNHK